MMPMWLAISLGVVGGFASLAAFLGLLMRMVDGRMDEKVRMGSDDVRRLAAKLENGLLSEIHEQGVKIDALAAELAEVKARLDTFIELWKTRPRA